MIKENEIQYQFTAMPLNLTLCLDNNCRVMLFTLIQLSSHYANEEGYFFRTNEDLKAQTNFSENLVRATLSTLYDNGIVNVRSVGKSKGTVPNFFKVNFESFLRWEKINIEDCIKNPLYKIETADYRQKRFKVSYLKDLEEDDNKADENKEEHTTVKSEMPQTTMDVAKAVVKQRRSPNTSLTPSQSEYNIDNVENINKNSLKATSNTSSIKEEKQTLPFDDYKKEEDRIMDKLYTVKSWSDFCCYRKDYQSLLYKTSNPKWSENTTKRFKAIEAARLKYFAKKYSHEPYNPIAQEIYERTGCGWKKEDVEANTNEKQEQPEDFSERSQAKPKFHQAESLDNQWAAYCEKQHQDYLDREFKTADVLIDDIHFGRDGNNLPF